MTYKTWKSASWILPQQASATNVRHRRSMLEKVADSARKAVKLAEPYKPYGGQFLEFCSISLSTYQTCMKLTRKSTELCQFSAGSREVPEYDFSCQNPWRRYGYFIRRFRAVKSSGVRNLCVCRHCLGYDRKHVTFPRYAFLFWKFVPKSKLPAENRCFSYQICTRKIFLHPMTQNLHTKHGSYESQSTRILRAEKSYGARLEKIRSGHTDFGTENRTPEPPYYPPVQCL